MISGLHSCQQKNTPYVGDVKTFVLEQRTGKSGKAWTKIRSAGASDGGTPYEIMSVTKTDYADSHGNISFNLEIEPVTVSESRSEAAVPRPMQNGYEDRSARIERQHSQHMAVLYAGLKEMVDITPTQMRELIDWFQRDVGRSPAKVKAKPAEPQHEEAEAMPTDGSEEF